MPTDLDEIIEHAEAARRAADLTEFRASEVARLEQALQMARDAHYTAKLTEADKRSALSDALETQVALTPEVSTRFV